MTDDERGRLTERAIWALRRLKAERDALRARVAELEARPPATVYVPAARCEACRGRGRFDISPRCLWRDGTGLEQPVRTGPAGGPG